jgi:hypothetical protein
MRSFRYLLCALCVLCGEFFSSAEASDPWEFTASANVYILQDLTYLDPVLSADKSHLHLEARYNYEDLDTGSIFAGYNFHVERTVEITATPIVGGVFGNSNGIAPGFLFDFNYGKFNFSTQTEYLFSSDEKESNFFYAWSEATYSPADWIWFGLAGQRTRAYHTDLEVQRGFLLGFGKNNFGITGYLMNPGWGDSFGVVTVEYQF